MKKFQILPHTADVKIKARGKNYQELFKNALLGMMEILLPAATRLNLKSPQRIPTSRDLRGRQISNLKIKVESQNINSLLTDFLNEVLYQTQVNREIYIDARFSQFPKLTEIASPSILTLETRLFGYQVSKFEEDIKAATYHGKGIKKTPKGYEVIVLLDI